MPRIIIEPIRPGWARSSGQAGEDKWFSRTEVHNIAAEFRNSYNAKYGPGQENDVNLTIFLLDRGTRNRPLAGGYGANIESKLLSLGANSQAVREALERFYANPGIYDAIFG